MDIQLDVDTSTHVRGFLPATSDAWACCVGACASLQLTRRLGTIAPLLQEYFSSMPWLAIPFEESALRAQLSSKFGVTGIPRLIMLGPSGEASGLEPGSSALAISGSCPR